MILITTISLACVLGIVIFCLKRYRDTYPINQTKDITDFTERNIIVKPVKS